MANNNQKEADNGRLCIYDSFAQYNAKSEGDVKRKGQFDYLPWATAWEEVLKYDPSAVRTIERDPVTNLLYSVIGNSAVVAVSVTIWDKGEEDCITRTEVYPIETTPMHATPLDQIDASKWNKAVQRATVKCLAMFGLGLQLYRGEDLTEFEKDEISGSISDLILQAKSRTELESLYKDHKSIIDSTPKLVKMFQSRSKEIKA